MSYRILPCPTVSVPGLVRQRRWDEGVELPARLYYSATARGPGLAVSRSLGDALAHAAGLAHAAEVTAPATPTDREPDGILTEFRRT